MAAKFDFSQAYRDLEPNASRELIDARQKGHELLDATVKTMEQVYDLCRLAFLLEPHPPSVIDWFEKPIRGSLDPHFLVNKDKAEAGRIAALLLRDRITRIGCCTPLAVLSASFCGRRHSADGDALTKEANEAFAAAVRQHRMLTAANPVSAPKFKAIAADVDPLAQHNPLAGSIAKTAIEAVAAASENAVKALAENIDAAMSSTHDDVIRLAEEVDMLWWHIGDWHELLEKPRSSASAETKMLASGIELGALVRRLPGPYGAYGILRRISGPDAEVKTTLRVAIESLSQNDARKLFKDVPVIARSLFPVHAGIQLVADRGPGRWESEFATTMPDIADVQLSFFDIGVQAYRERALISHGSLGK
jgi:hypothetical protein